MLDIGQRLLELMQEPPIAIEEMDPFQFPKSGLLVTKGKINEYCGSFLFVSGCLSKFMSYETCKTLTIEVRKRLEYSSIMANNAFQEIGEITKPIRTDLRYYKAKMKFVVEPCQYDFIIGKIWHTKHKAKIDCAAIMFHSTMKVLNISSRQMESFNQYRLAQ